MEHRGATARLSGDSRSYENQAPRVFEVNPEEGHGASMEIHVCMQIVNHYGIEEKVVYVTDEPASARVLRAAALSFYRSRHGKRLPFDACMHGRLWKINCNS